MNDLNKALIDNVNSTSIAIRLLDAELLNARNMQTITSQARLIRMGILTSLNDSTLGGVDALDGFAREAERDARNRVKQAERILNGLNEAEDEANLTIFTLSETIDTLRDIADILKSGGMPLELLIENLENIATVNEIHRQRLERETTFMEEYSNGIH